MKNKLKSTIYKDRYSELILSITSSLEKGEINRSKAEFLLGLILKRQFNNWIYVLINDNLHKEEQDSKLKQNFMYISYVKKFFQ